MPITHRQQHLLGINQIAAFLAVVFQNTGLDYRIHRAGFLAEAAEYALGQIDVIARGAPGAVIPLLGFDGNRQRRAYRLAQLAGNAALFPVGIAAQRMQPAKAGRLRGFFFGKVDRDFTREHIAPGEHHSLEQLKQQEGTEKILDTIHGFLLSQ